MKLNRTVKILLFAFIVVSLVAVLVACDLGGGDNKNSNKNKVSVDDMTVKGEIPGDIYYDPATSMITWGEVSDAEYYLVKFGENDAERNFKSNASGLAGFSGNNVFYVCAVRSDNTKTAVKSQEFTVVSLNLALDKANDAVTWTGNENVTSYHVSVKNADDKNATATEWDEQAGKNSASLNCIPESDCRYNVTVEAKVGRGTVLPDTDYYANVRRVRRGDFRYNGYNRSFTGFAAPIPGENATYTHHVIFGDEDHAFNGASYAYEPTGGTFTASTYTESNKANYLNSLTQTITVTEKPAVTNFASDNNGVLTWDAVEGADSYKIVLNGEVVTGTQDTTYNVADAISVGTLGEITVYPFFAENAYSSPSNSVSIFKRGAPLSLTFINAESGATYGTAGDSNFSVDRPNADSIMTGVSFNVVGPAPEENAIYNKNFVNNRTLSNNMKFNTVGEYTITITPVYDFAPGVITLGEDSSDTFTITRLAPLTGAEVCYVNGQGGIHVTGATRGMVSITKPNDQLADSSSHGTAWYNNMSIGSSTGESTIDLVEKYNDTGTAKGYSYKIYNTASYSYIYSNSVKEATLRSLSGLPITYWLTGEVGYLSLNNTATGLTWNYGDGTNTYRITDTVDNNTTTLFAAHDDETLDLSAMIEAMTFNDNKNHTIRVYVNGDPNNVGTKTFTSAGIVSITVRGSVLPDLRIFEGSENTTTETMHISNYAAGSPIARIGTTENTATQITNWVFDSSAAGKKIWVYLNGSTTSGYLRFRSPQLVYDIVAPEVTDTSITLNKADRSVSWTAVEHINKYKYIISGDGSASEDKITVTKTSNLNSILTGRQTFSITVSGYGNQEENTFYLPVSTVLTQTFYCFKLEVTREFNNNLTEVYYTVNVTPDGYVASAPVVNLHAYTNSVNYSHSGDTQLTDKVRTDLTSFIDTNVLPEVNFGSDRHAYLTFSVVYNEDYFIANNNAFLVGDAYTGSLGKHHDSSHDTYNYMVN